MKNFYKELVISIDENLSTTQLIRNIKSYPFVIKREDLLSVYVDSLKQEKRLKKLLAGFNVKEFLLKKDVIPPQNLREINIDGLIFKRRGKVSKNHIIISPGIAFGYDHPATALMIKKLLQFKDLYKNKRVLDVGVGTGILSLVMARKGARKVIGLDICPFVVKEAVKNVRRNHVKFKKIKILLKDISILKKRFTFTVANVPINVHKIISKSIQRLLLKDSFLMLGGILKENIELIKTFYNKFDVVELDFFEEWSTILLKR